MHRGSNIPAIARSQGGNYRECLGDFRRGMNDPSFKFRTVLNETRKNTAPVRTVKQRLSVVELKHRIAVRKPLL